MKKRRGAVKDHLAGRSGSSTHHDPGQGRSGRSLTPRSAFECGRVQIAEQAVTQLITAAIRRSRQVEQSSTRTEDCGRVEIVVPRPPRKPGPTVLPGTHKRRLIFAVPTFPPRLLRDVVGLRPARAVAYSNFETWVLAVFSPIGANRCHSRTRRGLSDDQPGTLAVRQEKPQVPIDAHYTSRSNAENLVVSPMKNHPGAANNRNKLGRGMK